MGVDMRRAYISGPMTGMPASNFPAFNQAAEVLQASGLTPVNPVDINPDPNTPWHECMRADIKALCDCDLIVMLPGWQKSQGAQLELHIAHRLGIEVKFIEEFIQ